MGMSIIQQAQELYSKTPELNTKNVIGNLAPSGNGITLHQQQHLGSAATLTHSIYLNKEDTEALYEWLKMLYKEQ